MIYDKPEGKVIFEYEKNNLLPFNVIEVKGDWVKLKKAFDREHLFNKSNNYEGWTQWKDENDILIQITEQLGI